PLIDARSRALAAAGGLAGGLAALLVAFLAWQLMPLARLQRRAAELLNGGGGADDWPVAHGEIGALARTLRHVWVERSQAELFNAQVMRKLSSVMSASPVGLAFIRDQRFELVSAECCHLLERQEQELLGVQAQRVFASDEEYERMLPELQRTLATGNTFVAEVQMRRANGSVFWARLLARPVAAADIGEGSIWSLYDASEQIVHRHRLEHAAAHDALTGVLNRKGFEKVLATTFEGQPDTRPASVVMIDLDHFKPINDSAGHAAGDAMLRAVAQAMGASVRASDSVARLGGDEFALMLAGCNAERALAIAEKVRHAITQLSLDWEGRRLSVGASLGVAELGARHGGVAAWLAEADAACYAAKRGGRGAVRTAQADAGPEPAPAESRERAGHDDRAELLH
ncbi:MAG: diguanylate cyclase, partial [Burkholderiales bacterium]|nr:diguanylate cyclase [Burkholderiales bacterium]